MFLQRGAKTRDNPAVRNSQRNRRLSQRGAQHPRDYRPTVGGRGGRFLHHFLPSIEGHQARESVELNQQLQTYFEYVVNLWLSFVPEPLKSKFPRNFTFPVTVQFSYLGELPAELDGIPPLSVSLEAFERPVSSDFPDKPQPDGGAPEA
jgi:hypothetical protein